MFAELRARMAVGPWVPVEGSGDEVDPMNGGWISLH
jgi:hypothetical protein